VISCPEGGIPDIVEDGINGILVPQKNIEALANAIEKLIYDSALRTKMGNEGRLKYEKQFTLETFEKKLVSILNK
jgi:glycosyltransferase involved in cell wall biosynthesis